MAITVAGIVGKEMWESFRKGRGEFGPYVDLSYLVDFASADAFVDGVLGGIVTAGGSIRNVPKLACPTNPRLYAMSAEYVGAGEANPTANGRPTFTAAVVEVRFAVPTWPQAFSDDPGGQQSFPNEATPGQPIVFAECEIDMGGEFVTVPQGSLVFLSDSKPIDAPVGKWVGVSTFRIVRHYYPNLPTTKVATYLNKLNNATFLGRARGLVRFANAKTRQVQTSDGTRTQSWEMIFEAREHDWNEFIRPDDMLFDAVGSPLDSTKQPYSYVDLAPLLA